MKNRHFQIEANSHKIKAILNFCDQIIQKLREMSLVNQEHDLVMMTDNVS